MLLQPIELLRGAKAEPLRSYTVSVTTGACKGAGTDAAVALTLLSPDGRQLGPRTLEATPADFERGRTDVFTLRAATLRESFAAVHAIVLTHDGTDATADWFVDRVTVQSDGVRDATFAVQQWLKAPAASLRIERTAAEAAVVQKRYRIVVHTGAPDVPEWLVRP